MLYFFPFPCEVGEPTSPSPLAVRVRHRPYRYSPSFHSGFSSQGPKDPGDLTRGEFNVEDQTDTSRAVETPGLRTPLTHYLSTIDSPSLALLSFPFFSSFLFFFFLFWFLAFYCVWLFGSCIIHHGGNNNKTDTEIVNATLGTLDRHCTHTCPARHAARTSQISRAAVMFVSGVVRTLHVRGVTRVDIQT